MGVYLVDRDLPGITREGLAAMQRAEISASQQLTAAGQVVRYLRSVFIPGEARCLCLFEAEEEAAVVAVNEVAWLPFTRIVDALDLTP
jgi:RNA:NAD 2'-phosphotransferase (TPT1/KptA family)